MILVTIWDQMLLKVSSLKPKPLIPLFTGPPQTKNLKHNTVSIPVNSRSKDLSTAQSKNSETFTNGMIGSASPDVIAC